MDALDLYETLPVLEQAKGLVIFCDSKADLQATLNEGSRITEKISFHLFRLQELDKVCFLKWLPAMLTLQAMKTKLSGGRGDSQTNAGIFHFPLFVDRVKETCTYANFPLLTELLQGVAVPAHQNVWFTHDSASIHFPIAVCNHLHAIYPGRCTGRRRPIVWLSESSNLNPSDFFFWGQTKSLVYQAPVTKMEDLEVRIPVTSSNIASTMDSLNTSGGVGCGTMRCATSNNSCDNPLEHIFNV
ncbi:hypothetical protein TNCV_2773181 [Trichonephila clavipes]|nr:hypothetical protein TNCV_2773181 [Trichonephila clavipes]